MPSRVVASGRSACITTSRVEAVVAHPLRARRRRRRRAFPDRRRGRRRARAPTTITSGALDTITTGRVPRPRHDTLGHRAGERAARVVVERVREAGLAERKRPQRDDDACSVGRAPGRHGLRMLPTVDPVYSVAKGVFWPWLRWGLHWTIEGAHNIPTVGPGGAREQSRVVSRSVDPRVRGRPPRPARAVSSPRPSSSTSRCSARCCGPRTRSRSGGAGPTPPTRCRPAVDALARRRVRRRVPRGHDLRKTSSRWSPSRAPRASRAAPASPITPVGLWGTHRILTKGRTPHWQWGIAQTAVIGEPIVPGPDEHVKQTTDRMMAAIVECVARARELYPAPRRGEDAVVVARSRAPRARTGEPRDASRGGRRGFVGYGGGRDRRPERVDRAVGAARRARREHRHRPRESRLPAPASRFPPSCTRPPISPRRAPTPTSWCSRCRRTACARCWPRRGRTSRPARRS